MYLSPKEVVSESEIEIVCVFFRLSQSVSVSARDEKVSERARSAQGPGVRGTPASPV